MPNFKLTPPSAQATGVADLYIYGDIGESWSEQSVAASDLVAELKGLSATRIVVHVNSYGGSVSDGLAIYNQLRSHPAEVEVRVEGVAVSIASLIAMAGDRILMAPASLMMIHAPWGGLVGNAKAAREFAGMLDRYADAMASAYAAKTGKPHAEVLALVTDGDDHWFTGEEAVEQGYADEITDTAPANLAAAGSLARYLPGAPASIAASLNRFHSGGNPMPGNAPSNSPSGASEPNAAAIARAGEFRSLLELDVLQGADLYQEVALASLDPAETAEKWRNRVLSWMASQASPAGSQGTRVDAVGSGVSGGGSDFVNAASDALLMRAGYRVASPSAGATDIRGMSLLDLARTCASRSGRGFGSEGPERIIKAAMSTSDFSAILSDAVNKALRRGMEAEQATHRNWCRVSNASDFKQQSRVILGSAPDLELVGELGEYKNGALAEDKSTLRPHKFGRIVSLSWEAIVNDDAGAFLGIARSMGTAAMRLEADALYALLTAAAGAGQTLDDGLALFDVARNNAVAAPSMEAKLDAIALGLARAKLRRQTAVGGGLLNLAPRTLIVPPERESEAEILVAQSTVHRGQSNSDAATPTWISSLQVIAEPRLTNLNTCYVVASPELIDCGEVSVLDGHPSATEDTEFRRDALSWKIKHVFAAGFLDFRGIVKLTLTEA